MNPIIEFSDVYFEYASDDEHGAPLKLLRGFNLKIEEGSFVALLGHNGSGKSTVARLINGLNQPKSGRVLVNGMDTADETRLFDIRSTVGMVLQNPDNQLVASIVEEDVAFGPENLGVDSEEIRERVDEALCAVGMYEYRNHAPHKLSGGQKQRVAIAGVLAMRPDCIVLDEPTAMLDPKGRAEVMNTVKDLNIQGITVVMITHFMEEAAESGRVIVLSDGEIVMDGTPSEIFARTDEIKSYGLEVPVAAELLQELRQAGIDIRQSAVDASSAAAVIAEALGLK